MARFILDVASHNKTGIMTDEEQKVISLAVCEALNVKGLTSGIVTINPIDNTNDNQFYSEFDNGQTNELTQYQIDNFKQICNE